jgi:hypothetical protein
MKAGAVMLAMALAAPPVAAACILAADSIAGAMGGGLLWSRRPVSVSEALLLRDAGETRSQFLAGVDPNEPAPVTSGSRPTVRMLPLEAAIRSGELPLVRLVLGHGARGDGATATRLVCLADRLGELEIAESLRGHFGIAAPCAGQ